MDEIPRRVSAGRTDVMEAALSGQGGGSGSGGGASEGLRIDRKRMTPDDRRNLCIM